MLQGLIFDVLTKISGVLKPKCPEICVFLGIEGLEVNKMTKFRNFEGSFCRISHNMFK
jgi:hypothetical protein